jgi:uncharacterized protein with HEPN domain
MKHPERVEDYLEHIAEAIERATGYLQPVPDLAAFKKNPQVQDAVVRNIEIIGEAVNKINSTAPRRTSSNRTRSFHGRKCAACATPQSMNIFFVDLEIVWTTIKDDLPKLKQQVDALLKR